MRPPAACTSFGTLLPCSRSWWPAVQGEAPSFAPTLCSQRWRALRYAVGISGAARYTTASVRQSNETMLVRQAMPAARTAAARACANGWDAGVS